MSEDLSFSCRRYNCICLDCCWKYASCFTASVSARGKSDKVDLNVNRTFLVVLVGRWKIIPQLCKDPAAIEIKIYTNLHKSCVPPLSSPLLGFRQNMVPGWAFVKRIHCSWGHFQASLEDTWFLEWWRHCLLGKCEDEEMCKGFNANWESSN